MKITKKRLRRIIKEEVQRRLHENPDARVEWGLGLEMGPGASSADVTVYSAGQEIDMFTVQYPETMGDQGAYLDQIDQLEDFGHRHGIIDQIPSAQYSDGETASHIEDGDGVSLRVYINSFRESATLVGTENPEAYH